MTKFVANANNASLQTSDQTGGGQIRQLQARVTVTPDKFDIDTASTVNNLVISGQAGLAPVVGNKLYVDVAGTVSVQTINTLSNQNAIDSSWGLLTIKECPETGELFILGSSNGKLAVSKDGGTSWKYAGQALGAGSVPLIGTSNTLRSVTKFAGRYFLGVGGTYKTSPSTGTYGLATSSDLINWSIANQKSFAGVGSSIAVQNGSVMISVYAGNGINSTGEVRVYKTIDGTTFTQVHSSAPSWYTWANSLYYANGYFSFGAYGAGGYSTNGSTWTVFGCSSNIFISSIYKTSFGWLHVNSNAVYKTSNSDPLVGLSAVVTGTSGQHATSLTINNNTIMFKSFHESSSDGYFCKSTDGGATWSAWSDTLLGSAIILGGGSLAYSSISGKWFYSSNTAATLITTSNKGTTWTSLSLSGAGAQYSVTTSGMPLAAVPAFVAKAGHAISASAHNTANTPSLIVASSYSYARNVDDVIITTSNRTGLTANFAQIKVASINNTDEVTKIEFIMQVYSAGQFNQGSGTYGSGSMILANGEIGEFIPTDASGWFANKGA